MKNYISISEELFEYYKIADKIDKLYEEWNLFSIEEWERKLNVLDLEITNLLIGTKKYHKLRAEVVVFSLQLSKLGLI